MWCNFVTQTVEDLERDIFGDSGSELSEDSGDGKLTTLNMACTNES